MNKNQDRTINPRRYLIPLISLMLLCTGSLVQANALHDASRSGDLDQVQKLVIDGADVNAKAVRAETPIMYAALSGQGDVVNYLLQRGADINARNASGMTALHAAAYSGHSLIVSLLIAKGAAVNDAENRYQVTPLHLASEENHLETVRILLDQQADTSAVEINGYSVVSRAGFREHWDVVVLLLASGASCQDAEKVGPWLFDECSSRAQTN